MMGDPRADFDRLRDDRSRRERRNLPSFRPGAPAMVGKVTSAATKIGINQFVTVAPTSVLGAEVEGGAGIFSSSSASIPVLLLGPGTPATGDYLICRFVAHRWVAERGGAGKATPPTTVLIPGCSCAVPTTLTMTSGDPTCNYGMFQSCILQYGPPPSDLAACPGGINGNIIVSTSTFYDPVTYRNFYYYLTCYYNQFQLTRFYPATYGSGGCLLDGKLYSWIVGNNNGNTCTPFVLGNGTPYPGSSATCQVTITG